MDSERIEKKIIRLLARAEELETLAREFRNRAKVFRSQADDMRKTIEQQKRNDLIFDDINIQIVVSEPVG